MDQLLTSTDLTTFQSLFWGLAVFRYVAFHYAQKLVTRLSVYTSLPTACVIPYFVQTWRYIPLFIISAPSTYFIHSDWLWNWQSGDWILAGSDVFILVHPMYIKSFHGTGRPERSAGHPPSSAEVELYLRFTSPPSYACHVVTFTFTLTNLQYIWHGDKYLQRLE